MRLALKKKKLLLLLALPISVLFILTVTYLKSEEAFIRVSALLCRKDTIREQGECFEEKILKRTESNPKSIKPLFNTLWKLGEQGKLSYDMRIFSPIIHDVGMQLIETKTPLADAISLCPLSFRGGCIHGVIMEYLDDMTKDTAEKKMLTICEPFKNNQAIYKNCFHALGHEFAAKSKGSLNEVLTTCKKIRSAYQNDCIYGVLMESSKGKSGTGHHLESPIGKYSPSCESVDLEFKSACYISVGFYSQYEADSEPWQATYEKCLSQPKEYQDYCFQGIAGALLFSKAMNKGTSSLICKTLSKDMQEICLNSF